MHPAQPAVIAASPKPSFMKRLFKRLLFWCAILMATLLIGLVVIAAFFEKQIGRRVLQEVNKQITSELSVESIDLSLLSGFPKASVNLHKVVLEDAFDGVLLEADQLSFRFGLFSLFSSAINVQSVVVEDGALFIHIDRNGRGNYAIGQASNNTVQKASTSQEKAFSLSIDEARLKEVELIYIDDRVKQELKGRIREGQLSGEFSNRQFSLYTFIDLQSNFIEMNRQRYLAGKDILLDASLDVDLTEGHYTFNDVDLGIETNVFKVNGDIISKGSNTDFDLHLTAEDGSLASVLSLLPEQQLEYFSDFSSKGSFIFNASVKGRMNAKENPAIAARLGLKRGKISSKKLAKSIKDVTFSATFTNGKSRNAKTTVFEIKDFRGYFNRELIESYFRLTNVEDPKIDLQMDGVLPLASMYGLLGNEAISDGDGELEIKNLELKGRLKDMQRPSRIGRVKTSGEIEFDDAALTINQETVTADKGSLTFRDNSIAVNDVKIEGAGSEFMLKGSFLNLLPVLLADSLNSRRAELKFDASLDAIYLDFDRLLKLVDLTEAEEQQLALAEQENKGFTAKGVHNVDQVNLARNQRRERLTKFLKGTFHANIESYDFEKIEGESYVGTFQFANNQLIVKGSTDAMDGHFILDGKAFFNKKPFLKATIECEDINIHEFFRQTENFGQQVLLAKNLKGLLKARIAVDAFWDEALSFQYDDLRVIGDLSISDGELIGFKMFYDFSNYIKMRDLQHIRFKNIRNWLEIKNSKVHIPAMFLQSNALNMTISGEHSFDHHINYFLKINAGQVFLNKFKRYNPRLTPQPSKKKGWFNLYYRIFGTVDDFEVKTDKRTVQRHFEYSDRRKQQIQDRLIRVFGERADSMDDPSDWKNIPDFPSNTRDEEVLLEDTDNSFEVPKEEKPELPDSDETEEYLWEDDGLK